jgi:hypothetical protein
MQSKAQDAVGGEKGDRVCNCITGGRWGKLSVCAQVQPPLVSPDKGEKWVPAAQWGGGKKRSTNEVLP